MSDKKMTPEKFLELQREKAVKLGKPFEKGLPLQDPPQSLVSGSTETTSTGSATNDTDNSASKGGKT